MVKAELLFNGRPLLEHALAAGSGGCHQVVVGLPELTVPSGVSLVREDPPFGGPVAGIAAGTAELERLGCLAEWMLIIACDHPRAAEAGPALVGAVLADPAIATADLIAPVDSTGHVQNLFALYRRSALVSALAGLDGGRNTSVRRLVAGLATYSPVLADGLLDDVDDPESAERMGIVLPGTDSVTG